jgi:hypothetical protein
MILLSVVYNMKIYWQLNSKVAENHDINKKRGMCAWFLQQKYLILGWTLGKHTYSSSWTEMRQFLSLLLALIKQEEAGSHM